MGEIVRVLKWRLDLDAGAFATEIEKAATGAEKLAAAAAKVAGTAPSALKATAAAAKEADSAFEGLEYETQQLLRYVQSLEKGAGSPLVLKRNSEQAAAAFNVLAASAQKAGIAIPEAFGARVTAAIGKATTQAAAMNAELEKMGGQTPTKLDKVITALGSTERATSSAAAAMAKAGAETVAMGKASETASKAVGEKLGDSMRKSTEGLNKFRGAALETWAALQLGVQAGNALAGAIDKQSEKQAAHDKRMTDAAVATIKFHEAMKLAERGLIDIGGTQDQFLARYDAYIAKTNPAVKATEAQTKAFKDQQTVLKDLGTQLEAIGKSVSFTINAPKLEEIMPLEEATKYAQALSDILGKAFADGGAEERDAWAAANQETLDKVVAAFQKWGEALPPTIAVAYDAMKAGAKQTAAEILADLEKAVTEATRLRQDADAQGAANRDRTTATEAAARAQRALNDATHDGITEMNGWVGVSGPATAVTLSINQASKERIELLKEELRATKALREEQLASLDATKGWMDYVVALNDGLKTGTTSLYNYVTELTRFKTQLEQLFGGVTGKAKEELEAMIDAIQRLIATAGAGGPTPKGGGYKGAFERGANGR